MGPALYRALMGDEPMTTAADRHARDIRLSGIFAGDRYWPDLALIALLWIGVAILINPVGDFPINDDWTYKLAVERVLQDGTFALPSGSTANVVIQAYWGALFCLPFGLSYTALRLSTLVLAMIGLFAAYGTAREVGARRTLALVTAATFAAAPLYLPLAASFMTDVPFTNVVGIAFYCLARGMRRKDRRFVILAFVVAFASILHRQFGLLVVIAFGAAMVAQARGSLRSVLLLIGVTGAGIALQLAFQHWMMTTHRMRLVVIGGAGDFGPGADPKNIAIAIANLFCLLPYLGLMLFPLYCATGFTSARQFIREKPWTARIIAILVAIMQIAAAWNRERYFPDYGNNLTRRGLGPTLLYDRWTLNINQPAEAFPQVVWTLLFVLAAIGVVAIFLDLAGAAARLIRRFFRGASFPNAWVDGSVLAFVLSYGLLVCMMTIRPSAFDRYMLPFMPAIALLILTGSDQARIWTKKRIVSTAAAICAFGLFSIVATADYLAWHRHRWQATDYLAQIGVAPDHIDGGYEYNGSIFYAREIHPDWSKPFQRSWWWLYDDEYIIGGGPVPGYRIMRRYPYYRTLTRSWDQVVILHRLPDSRGEIGNFKPPVPR